MNNELSGDFRHYVRVTQVNNELKGFVIVFMKTVHETLQLSRWTVASDLEEGGFRRRGQERLS